MTDFTTVTEIPGNQVTREALEMICARYTFAQKYCEGMDVLEVACGAGQGLGLLAQTARSVTGGDYTSNLLQLAKLQYADRVPLLRLDAHAMPFCSQSFDVILLFEAIYYLEDPDRFVEEAKRLLRPKGLLLIVTVNRDWLDFNPSPFSTKYFGARELNDMLCMHGFSTELYGAFPTQHKSRKAALVSAIKRFAIKAGLMPKTMKGKELFKRFFFGRLVPIPPELTVGAPSMNQLLSLSAEPTSSFKVLWFVARISSGLSNA